MSITFRIDDGIDTRSIIPANITPHQLGSLRDCLLDHGERLGHDLIFTDYGEPGDASFSFEARVCPLALSTVSNCFDHFPGVITVVDEAQFRGRRIRVWRVNGSPDILLGLASNPDDAPELNVSTSNGYALLESLGLDAESVGAITMTDLRERLMSPSMRRRLDDEPGLARYVPTLLQMASAKPIEGELLLVWA
jgi:hypothetical protein